MDTRCELPPFGDRGDEGSADRRKVWRATDAGVPARMEKRAQAKGGAKDMYGWIITQQLNGRREGGCGGGGPGEGGGA